MKRLIEDDGASGLEELIGETVLLMCANYFYAGKLVGVNTNCVELAEAAIVYEPGQWSDKGYKDAQKLAAKKWFVSISAIESYGVGK
jgi:hypothetical protein